VREGVISPIKGGQCASADERPSMTLVMHWSLSRSIEPGARSHSAKQSEGQLRQNIGRLGCWSKLDHPARQIPTLCAHDHLADSVFNNLTVATFFLHARRESRFTPP
jgi:hypothetical protein